MGSIGNFFLRFSTSVIGSWVFSVANNDSPYQIKIFHHPFTNYYQISSSDDEKSVSFGSLGDAFIYIQKKIVTPISPIVIHPPLKNYFLINRKIDSKYLYLDL